MKWHAMVAIILASGISIGIILITLEGLLHPEHFSMDETLLLSTILGAAVGAIAAYLGLHSDDPPR